MAKVFWATGRTFTEQLAWSELDRTFAMAAAIQEIEERSKRMSGFTHGIDT
ncbi:hypothetical protein CLOSTMETH_01743 [[Clostridium] methylpentosum DSM 5476]|uniref:Uncharacterized protein n=1 Tax=[Clostridium] methylpentosum DSM 5476 TaxID=537013 RepID=C0ED22_9FIRM|nr:hypothetical protein CLOSTMETH_01743 [[Clostridium] methylpentosum DSM 5476]